MTADRIFKRNDGCEYALLAIDVRHAAVIDHPRDCGGQMRKWSGFILNIYWEIDSDDRRKLRCNGYFTTDHSDCAYPKTFLVEEIKGFVDAGSVPKIGFPARRVEDASKGTTFDQVRQC